MSDENKIPIGAISGKKLKLEKMMTMSEWLDKQLHRKEITLLLNQAELKKEKTMSDNEKYKKWFNLANKTTKLTCQVLDDPYMSNEKRMAFWHECIMRFCFAESDKEHEFQKFFEYMEDLPENELQNWSRMIRGETDE